MWFVDQVFDLFAVRFLVWDFWPELCVQVTHMTNLCLELLQSLLVLEVLICFWVVFLSQWLVLDSLYQLFFQNLNHGMDLNFSHETVIIWWFHDQMFVLFQEVIRFSYVLFNNTIFVSDHHQLNNQQWQSAFLMHDFLDFLFAQTLELWWIVLFHDFSQEELFDLSEQVEFGFSFFEFVEDVFTETLRVSAWWLVFEEENEDVVDSLSVVEQTVQENLIVTTVAMELVPFERFFGGCVVEE